MTWESTGELAPGANEMHHPDPQEFVRRYPGSAALVAVLDAAMDVVEDFVAAEKRGSTGPSRGLMIHLEAALEAMTGKEGAK